MDDGVAPGADRDLPTVAGGIVAIDRGIAVAVAGAACPRAVGDQAGEAGRGDAQGDIVAAGQLGAADGVADPGKAWTGPYLDGDAVPKDQWGNEWNYRQPGQHRSDGFDLWSNGPDGREGGDDDIANWSK